MSGESIDERDRILRLKRAVDAIARNERPEPIENVGDGPLGELERSVNDAVKALSQRDQEHLLFSVGPCVMFRWKNTDGWPVEYVSPNVVELTGYPAEDFASQKVAYAGLMHPDDVDRIAKELDQFNASGADWYEQSPYRIIRRDGRIIWVADYALIIRNKANETTHYVGYVFDITERIEQTQKLAQKDQALLKLSSPMLRVWEGIVAVPLMEGMNEARAGILTTRLLEEISAQSIVCAILDLTGLVEVDNATMEQLLRVMKAVELLGAKCLVSGISPQAARVMVTLGIDVSRVPTFATLSAALEHALGRVRIAQKAKRS